MKLLEDQSDMISAKSSQLRRFFGMVGSFTAITFSESFCSSLASRIRIAYCLCGLLVDWSTYTAMVDETPNLLVFRRDLGRSNRNHHCRD